MASTDTEVWTSRGDSQGPARGAQAASRAGRLLKGLGTLKARLTLAAVGSLAAGILLISVLSLTQIEDDLLAQTRARELAQTANIAQDLSQRAVVLQQTLRATVDRIEPATERDEVALERHLLAQPLLLQQFANLFVAAPDGHMRLVIDEAGPRRPRISLADRDYFRKTVREKRPVISEAVPGRVSGEPVIVFAHPVMRGGVVTSVMGGAIRLTSRNLAASLLDKDSLPGQDELLVITDEAGLLVAHPRGDLVLKRLSAEARLAQAYADWTSKGSPAEPLGLLLEQPNEIVTAAGVAGTGWVVWRSLPYAALLEPINLARWQALRNAALVILIVAVLVYVLVQRLLRPLQRLEARALHLFDTQRGIHDDWPEDGGEVGSLAHVLRHVGAERAHLEAFTNELLGRLRSVMAAAPLGIGLTRHQCFELINPAWCRMLQCDEPDILGHRAVGIFASERDYEQLGPLVLDAFAQAGEYQGEWRLRRKDGSEFWAQLCGRPVEPGNPAAGTIWTCADVTDIRASRENLEWTATHDALTGLANRTAFESRLRLVLGHGPAALIAIDLDHFKPINDSHGHAAGDAMLKRVASAISAQIRAGDLAVRVGGDEFAVVLERCPPEAALRVADDIQRAISRAALTWAGQTLNVGASVGVAPLSDEFDTVEAWIAAADAACYSAKAAGRGTVRLARSGPPRLVELPRDELAG